MGDRLTAATTRPDPLAPFDAAAWMDWLGRIVCDRPRWMRAAADLETRLFADRLAPIEIDGPTWIAGLARSGSTILLELLAEHPAAATQRYRDFPPVFTPILWDRLLDRMPLAPEEAGERAHGDGIMVTSDSPEAFEEPLWMAFFPALHDPQYATIDATTSNPAFERFFRNHLRKLLLVRAGTRYLAKANYNVTRLRYLLRLFPDARFILPIREPVWHVASLMKQHQLFCTAERRYPRARRHLARAGHFEFGFGRRPIHGGNPKAAEEISRLWAAGAEVEAWSAQWSEVYGFLARELESDAGLRRAACVVRYEDLVREPGATMQRLLEHCRLEPSPRVVETAAARLRFPGYYTPAFAPAELATIRRRTAEVADRFGYETAT